MPSQVLTFVLFPAAAVLVGGVAAAFRPPGDRLRSVLQHFAAGVVFAAVSGELLPALMHEAAPVPVVVGFTLGVALMLGVKRLTEPAERAGDASEAEDRPGGSARGLVTVVAVDVAIDGLLVGVAFAAGEEAGLLVTVALTLEVLFLGLATAAALVRSGASRGRVIGTSAGFAAVLALGAVVGGAFAGRVAGPVLEGVLAFGVAALLYLVTEELLVEAHEVPETPFTTATFFGGFLALLLVEMAL